MLLTQLVTRSAISLLGLATVPIWRQVYGWGDMPWGHMNGWGHMGGWGLGSVLLLALLLLVVVGAVVAAVVAVARSSRSGPRPADDAQAEGVPGPEDRARVILAERYARGEIDTEEYRERLHELR